MKIFILEDDPHRITRFKQWYSHHDLTITDQAADAIEILKSEKFDLIFLDHDLGGQVYVDSSEKNTGYTVACELSSTVNSDTTVVIHSMNPTGSNNMKAVLEKHCQVHQIPFSEKIRGLIL